MQQTAKLNNPCEHVPRRAYCSLTQAQRSHSAPCADIPVPYDWSQANGRTAPPIRNVPTTIHVRGFPFSGGKTSDSRCPVCGTTLAPPGTRANTVTHLQSPAGATWRAWVAPYSANLEARPCCPRATGDSRNRSAPRPGPQQPQDHSRQTASLPCSAGPHSEPAIPRSRVLCGAEGDRTPDLLTASQALSQLSYGPVGTRKLTRLDTKGEPIFFLIRRSLVRTSDQAFSRSEDSRWMVRGWVSEAEYPGPQEPPVSCPRGPAPSRPQPTSGVWPSDPKASS